MEEASAWLHTQEKPQEIFDRESFCLDRVFHIQFFSRTVFIDTLEFGNEVRWNASEFQLSRRTRHTSTLYRIEQCRQGEMEDENGSSNTIIGTIYSCPIKSNS